jgi:hypothetical protein
MAWNVIELSLVDTAYPTAEQFHASFLTGCNGQAGWLRRVTMELHSPLIRCQVAENFVNRFHSIRCPRLSSYFLHRKGITSVADYLQHLPLQVQNGSCRFLPGFHPGWW